MSVVPASLTIIEGTDTRPLLDIAVQGAREDGYREGLEAGRDEASAFWPLCDQEGYLRGRDAERNDLARRLRVMARDNDAARDVLLELLR